MLLTKSKINLSIALLVIACNGFYKTYGQTNTDATLYNWFDTNLGKENSGINNGPYHSSPYKTLGNNNMYLTADTFTKGTVFYDGQPYYDVKLKYDVYRDQLVLNPHGEPDYFGITLIQDKMDAFSIYGKKFVKLNLSTLPEFQTGYYEEYKTNEDMILYIKHHKDIQKQINNDGLYYSFTTKNKFLLSYRKAYYEVNSKSDLAKIFPENKRKINDFYSLNRELLKSDKDQFMKNLIFAITTSLSNKAN